MSELREEIAKAIWPLIDDEAERAAQAVIDRLKLKAYPPQNYNRKSTSIIGRIDPATANERTDQK